MLLALFDVFPTPCRGVRTVRLLLCALVGLAVPAAAQENQRSLDLTAAEQAWLAEAPAVRVHVGNNPPFLIPGNGDPSGIAIDFLRLISRRTGITCQWVYEPGSIGEALEVVRDRGGIDLLPATMGTEERETFLSFTEPYLTSPIVIFTRSDFPFISGIGDLAGKTVSLTRNTPLTRIIIQDYPEVILREFDTAEKAMAALASGLVDAFAGNVAVGTHVILEHQISNVKVAAPSPLPILELACGARKDWPELVGILQKALATVTPNEKDK